jgi:prevent-host-death family protein
MIKATISEAKSRLSHFIDLAKNGETVLITDRGVPVVRLESAARSHYPGLSPEDQGRIERLERSGVLRVAERPPLDPAFFDRPLPKAKDGASILQALLDEREESR